MTTFERFEREIPRLMDELSPPRLPDYLDDMLRQTARTSQRPAWSAFERWLPMGVIAQTQTIPRIPWRPILAVGLLVLLAAAAVLVVGSRQQPLPEPFGVARNGAIVFSTADGDIVQADPDTGAIATLIAGAGSGFDSAPWFANDGTKFAFDRQTVANAYRRSLAVANADGTEVRVLGDPSSPIRWFDWSPTGDRMLVLREDDPFGQVSILDAETGEPTTFTVDFEVRAGTFRPDSDELVLSGPDGAYRVGVDGTGLRKFVDDPAWLDQYSISPDGSLLAYATWAADAAGRIHVVEIDSGIERPNDFDPGVPFNDLLPLFMPDGEALLIERHDQAGYKPTILPLDGGPALMMGPYHASSTGGAGVSIAPDGTKVIATYRVDGTTWLLDTATGEGEQLDWPVPSDQTATWQRLAP